MTPSHSSRKTGFSWAAVIVILMTMAAHDITFDYWKDPHKIIFWDVLNYYAYLPAIYVHNDISLGFLDENPSLRKEQFWPHDTPTGRHVIKTTMGLAFLYAPFFWVAHPAAQMLGYPADGFSGPYRFILMFSALFYLAAGLLCLKKVLERYFSDPVVALALVSVTLGTNLLHYSTYEATMPHSYSFSLFSMWLYLCLKWHDRPDSASSIGLGLLSGLISLIRPTNALVGILFVLWGVTDLRSLKERALLLIKNWPLLTVIVMTAIAVWIPQMLYWKFTAGTFWFYSYGNERFFFDRPHIIQGLFGFRKGWLLYTPMMALALAGIGLLYKHLREWFYPILIFTVLNVYVILSWWSWWYGGGFGLRPVIESYSILSIPLAVLFAVALKKRTAVKAVVLTTAFIVLALNIFQTHQYRLHLIHWDGMTARAYWAVLLRLEKPDNFQELIERPDYDSARLGLKEVKGKAQSEVH
ncbi:MAG: hypothetical protein AB1724_14035 [Thermodesulfobacteriota bacterium]